MDVWREKDVFNNYELRSWTNQGAKKMDQQALCTARDEVFPRLQEQRRRVDQWLLTEYGVIVLQKKAREGVKRIKPSFLSGEMVFSSCTLTP